MVIQVPELVGCLILTVVPQCLICIYFLGLQQLRDVTMPLEIALNACYLIFLLPEVVLCYRATKAVIRSQAANFFLSMDVDDDQETGATGTNAEDWKEKSGGVVRPVQAVRTSRVMEGVDGMKADLRVRQMR